MLPESVVVAEKQFRVEPVGKVRMIVVNRCTEFGRKKTSICHIIPGSFLHTVSVVIFEGGGEVAGSLQAESVIQFGFCIETGVQAIHRIMTAGTCKRPENIVGIVVLFRLEGDDTPLVCLARIDARSGLKEKFECPAHICKPVGLPLSEDPGSQRQPLGYVGLNIEPEIYLLGTAVQTSGLHYSLIVRVSQGEKSLQSFRSALHGNIVYLGKSGIEHLIEPVGIRICNAVGNAVLVQHVGKREFPGAVKRIRDFELVRLAAFCRHEYDAVRRPATVDCR